MSKGKIYIAGPMRNYEALNFEEFFVTARRLRKLNWEVENPAAYDVKRWFAGETLTEKEILSSDIQLLVDCDAIFMLDGWDKSDGARMEYYFAKGVGMEVIFQSCNTPIKRKGYKMVGSLSNCEWWIPNKVYFPNEEGYLSDEDGDIRARTKVGSSFLDLNFEEVWV